MISTLTTECCNGVAYSQENGYACCGSQYIETDRVLCCTGSTGVSQVRAIILLVLKKSQYFINL